MAISVAVICLCAFLSFPVGEVPFTLQTFGVCLVSGLLGWKRGCFVVATYLLLGLVGVPVFAGFTGGAAKFTTPTAGYLVGFLFTAVLTGLSKDFFTAQKGKKALLFLSTGMSVGVLACYLFGTVWFMLFVGEIGLKGVWTALCICVFPFLPFDVLKIVLAAAFVFKLERFLNI